MKVLIIKTSSMGDIIHTLPALTDAKKNIPNISFDWVVEEAFAEIPRWHSSVNKIIPVAIRRWRKNLFSWQTWREWKSFKKNLQSEKYDLVLDAQGLSKSASLAVFARGIRAGLDWHSGRDPFASLCYHKRYSVSLQQHAVVRVRELFAKALGYVLPDSVPDYGVNRESFKQVHSDKSYLVFLHGTTWDTKHWPETYWIELTKIANQNGYDVKVTFGNDIEKQRAERIVASSDAVTLVPKLKLSEMVSLLAGAKGIVAVDTGLGHLAAALNVPTVSLYGPTNPDLTGAMGQGQKHLRVNYPCSPCLSRNCQFKKEDSLVYPPCFMTLPSELVWEALVGLW